MGELGLVLGLTGADTGLEDRSWVPLEKKPLEGLTEPKGLSACGEMDTRVGSLRPRPRPGPVTIIPVPAASPVMELLLHGTPPERQP